MLEADWLTNRLTDWLTKWHPSWLELCGPVKSWLANIFSVTLLFRLAAASITIYKLFYIKFHQPNTVVFGCLFFFGLNLNNINNFPKNDLWFQISIETVRNSVRPKYFHQTHFIQVGGKTSHSFIALYLK